MRARFLAIAIGTLATPLVLCAATASADPPALEAAQAMFYNGQYADAASATAELCTENAAALSACELKTSALLFQLRRAMGSGQDKDKAFAECAATCADLLSAFVAETRRGQAVARAALKLDPENEHLLFFLGKLDLNYVWLQLGTLGRKTGWDEYWEARHSLDKVLKKYPTNVRAKVARAWIDYIVDTRMPMGTRWVLGGGNKKRGLRAVREAAAAADADQFVRAEAGFALWDMQVRERNIPEAMNTARTLAEVYPANLELQKFLTKHANTVTQ
jgi:hypothetical protein